MYKLFVSLRYLRSNKIVYFSIAGVAIGIMILIIVTSVMGGFSRDLKERIRGIQSHVIVAPRYSGTYIIDYQGLVDRIKKIDGVKACAPRIQWPAWISTRAGGDNVIHHFKGKTVTFMGIDPAQEEHSEIANYFKKGGKEFFNFRFDDRQSIPEHNGIVAGSEMMRASFFAPITLVTVRPRGGGFSYCEKQFITTGNFKTGLTEYDSWMVMMQLEDAQRFLKLDKENNGGKDAITDVSITLDDYQLVAEIREKIDAILRENPDYGRLRTQTWEEAKEILLKAVAIEKAIQIIILFCIIIVAGFNIIAIFTLMVKAKTRDIGIMKSLGATTGGICVIFLVAGILCGTIGSVIGIAAGLGVSYNLNPINEYLRAHYGFDLFPKDVYYLDAIPVYVDYFAIAFIVASTMIVSLLASIYPAIKAARCDPIETIRAE